MKNQILIMGKNLFYKNGYSNTKITDITKKLGISTGNFYTYYSSKESLLDYLLREELEVVNREYITAINIEGTLNEVLNNFMLSIITITEKLKPLMLLKLEIEKNINKFSDSTILLLKDYDELLPIYIRRVLRKKIVKIDNLDLIVELICSEVKVCLRYMLESESIKGLSFNNKNVDAEIITKLGMYICDVFELKYKKNEKYDKLTKVYTEEYFLIKIKKIYIEGKMKDGVIYLVNIDEGEEGIKESFFFDSIMKEIPKVIEKNIKSNDILGLKNQIYFVIYMQNIIGKKAIKSIKDRLLNLLTPVFIKYFPNRSENNNIEVSSVEIDGTLNYEEIKIKLDSMSSSMVKEK